VSEHITIAIVAQRIMANHEAYVKHNPKKVRSEQIFYEEKKNVSEN